MLTAALAYLLAFILGLILGGFIAIITKILVIMLLATILGREMMMKSFLKISQPIDFITSIFHGFLAVLISVSVLVTFEIEPDFFLVVFLALNIFWMDLGRIRQGKALQDRLPDIANIQEDIPDMPESLPTEGNGMRFNPKMKGELNSQMQQLLYGNRIVMLIGKITGLIIGGLNLIGLG
ncbi:MAG: hypothetical protein GY810_15275 [Aureispira sp.]|nr:hypothetical protein [Aureispira sp.]